MELNPQLYEGVRFGWINVTSYTQPWNITAVRVVAQSKASGYRGSFRSSLDSLERVWYTAALVVRANLEPSGFGSILMDRGLCAQAGR